MLALVLAAALQTAPGSQVLGSGWVGRHVDVRGQVIAIDGACYELAIERQSIPGAGGRLWACGKATTPQLNTMTHVAGVVRDTRMTRMGNVWRAVPVVGL